MRLFNLWRLWIVLDFQICHANSEQLKDEVVELLEITSNRRKEKSDASKLGPKHRGDLIRCGSVAVLPRITVKIFGGEPTGHGRLPWQVSLRHRTANLHICGGSLLSSLWILTAAHCFARSTETNHLVGLLGKHNMREKEKGEVLVHFLRVVIHEKHIPREKIFDIAMLEVAEPIKYSITVRPICLPSSALDLKDGEKLIVAGWGRSTDDGEYTLHEVQVEYTPNGKCREMLPKRIPILDSMLCAGYSLGGKDACRIVVDHVSCGNNRIRITGFQGDSGGPLIRRNEEGAFEQVGIVSWGYGCGEKGLPGVYTRVSQHLWIAVAIGQ